MNDKVKGRIAVGILIFFFFQIFSFYVAFIFGLIDLQQANQGAEKIASILGGFVGIVLGYYFKSN